MSCIQMPPQGGDCNPIVKIVGGEATTDSRDVSAFFVKRHDDVIRAIKSLKCSPEFRARNFAEFKINDLTGETTSHFTMTKDGFAFAVLGFTGPKAGRFKELYIQRFNEMEVQLRSPQQASIADLLANPGHLLMLAQGYALQIEDLKRDVSGMRQDVSALDRIAGTDSVYGLRQTAQILQQQEKALVQWLLAHGWCYRQNGSRILMAYADKRPLLMTHKLDVFTKPNGEEGTRETLKFTTAGIVKLAKLIGVEAQFADLAGARAAA